MQEEKGRGLIDRYILVGKTPVPCEDLLEWARWFEAAGDARVVKRTTVLGMCDVSTVFLGLDHSFGYPHRPILFETMAFWSGEGGHEQERCSTWEEAEAQHEAMVRYVATPKAVLRYVGRTIRRWGEEARRDFGRRWRDLRGIEPSETEKLLESMRKLR